MYFSTLELFPFGPFRNAVYTFEPKGLHILYGKNEAGKSTTLRALAGFLYGIDAHSKDAHTFGGPALRIRARLVSDTGVVLDAVRRKGQKATLLSPDQTPLSESVLSPFLLGVSRTEYERLYAMNHVRLREGGQGLAQGKGDLGEAFFSAGLGTSVHRLLSDLTTRADALYTQKARNRPLNQALHRLTKAKESMRLEVRSHDAWEKQTEALRLAESEQKELDAARRDALANLHRLEEELRVRPLRAKLLACRDRSHALGRVPSVPKEISRERQDLARDEDEACHTARELSAKARVLREDLARLPDPSPLLSVPEGMVALLERSVGSVTQAEEELRDIEEARTAFVEEDPPASQASVRALRRTVQDAGAVLRKCDELSQKRNAFAEQRRGLLARAEALHLRVRSLSELLGLEVPDEEELLAFEDALRKATLLREQASPRVRELKERDARTRERAKNLKGRASHLSGRDLKAVRQARDQAFEDLLSQGHERFQEGAARARVLIDASDRLADTLISEGDLGKELLELERELVQTGELLAQEAEALRAAKVREEAARAAYRDRVAPLFDPPPPMETWRSCMERVRVLRSESRALLETEEALDEVAKSLAAERDACLPNHASLGDLEERADREEARWETQKRLSEMTARERVLVLRIAEFRRRVDEIVPPSIEGPLRARWERFLAEFRNAHAQRSQRIRLEEALRETEDLLRASEDKRVHASNRMRFLCERYGAGSPQELEELERKAEESRALSDEEARLREALLGREANTFEGTSDADLYAQAEALRLHLERLEAERRSTDLRLGGLALGLRERFDGGSACVEGALHHEEVLVEVEQLARRYAVLRIAERLLEREVHDKRVRYEGKALTRASALFADLTGGRFERIAIDFSDRDTPTLVCQRTGGTRVDLGGLSDGTLDQMFLALRLALLEEALQKAPLPVVFDDVCVHFDDERARNALVSLSHLARHTQVFFLTHHARMLTLAEEALPGGYLPIRLGDRDPEGISHMQRDETRRPETEPSW